MQLRRFTSGFVEKGKREPDAAFLKFTCKDVTVMIHTTDVAKVRLRVEGLDCASCATKIENALPAARRERRSRLCFCGHRHGRSRRNRRQRQDQESETRSEGGSDEAIHPFFTRQDGLLRFARNDGRGPGLRSLSSGAHSRDPLARNDGPTGLTEADGTTVPLTLS
jgi:hypothetical protein